VISQGKIKQAVANKKSPADIDAVLQLDAKRREIIREVEHLKMVRNTKFRKIAALKKKRKTRQRYLKR
jgi:seryl-tRNA synthetase